MNQGVVAGSDIPVLVLGGGVTALGVQRAFARAGIPYYTVERMDPLLRRSRWYHQLPPDSGVPDPGGLQTWLLELGLGQAVLLPCSDAWVTAVAGLDDQSRARFPASVAKQDVLGRLIDKGHFAQTLAELGIPHPWSQDVTGPGDLEDLSKERLAHTFLKPRNSQAFMKVFNVKAFKIDSLAEARARLADVQDAGLEVVAQEYIPGPAENHFFIDGFVDRSGGVRALFVRQRLRMYPPLFGNSTYMRSVGPDTASGAVRSIRALLRGLEYRGVFSAEFKLDPRDQTFKILEVNPRAWWYVGFAARCGVDMCSMAYRDALQLPVSKVESYPVGRRCVFPYPDYFACQQLRREGRMTSWQCLRSWVGANQPVFEWADPWPATAATAEILSGRAAKIVRRRT